MTPRAAQNAQQQTQLASSPSDVKVAKHSPFRRITIPNTHICETNEKVFVTSNSSKAAPDDKADSSKKTRKRIYERCKISSQNEELAKRAKEITDIIIAARDKLKNYNPHFHILYTKNLTAIPINVTSITKWLMEQNLDQTNEALAGTYLLLQVATVHTQIIRKNIKSSGFREEIGMLIEFITKDEKKRTILNNDDSLCNLLFQWLLYNDPASREKDIVFAFFHAFSIRDPQHVFDKNTPVTWVKPPNSCCCSHLFACFFRNKTQANSITARPLDTPKTSTATLSL